MLEILLVLMLLSLAAGLLSGYPVAFVLPGVSLIFAVIGHSVGVFDLSYVEAFPNRVFGIMMNELLLSIPLFIFMGVALQKSDLAEELLRTMSDLMRKTPAGLGLAVIAVGALMGASTGIVGATVVTMGLISLPSMMRANYSQSISTGVICASGTLGQIIPPSIVLILLADQMSNAYQSAQLQAGVLSPQPVSIADIFVGAIVPSFLLVMLYMLWMMAYRWLRPSSVPVPKTERDRPSFSQVMHGVFPPLVLIVIVLGSILTGIATATESAAIGALGALILACARKKIDRKKLHEVCVETAITSSMIFSILIGAALFTLVFRGFGGDDIIHELLANIPGGLALSIFVVMVVIFLLGFFLDFIEIIFVVVPIVAPALLLMGADPIWLSVLIAVNLQTSFLTPPFGFSLFYLRGVAPKEIRTTNMYRGVAPFIAIQALVIALISLWPSIATSLPHLIYGTELTIEAPVVEAEPEFGYSGSVDF